MSAEVSKLPTSDISFIVHHFTAPGIAIFTKCASLREGEARCERLMRAVSRRLNIKGRFVLVDLL